MKKYFFIENEIQKGPFSIDDLKDKNIHKKTLVWTEDFDNWVEANNIIELKGIIKIIPPPLPNNTTKHIKVEAQITKQKEKILTPERERLIAKETKQNYKFLKYSIVLGIIAFLYLVYDNQGFANKSIEYKLKDDMHKSIYNYDGSKLEKFLRNRENLKDESFSLGYDGYSKNYFDTQNAIKYHNNKFNETIKKSILPSFLVILVSTLVLIVGRYLSKGAKWIEEKSTI
jgi:hypothetical protein